MTKLDINQIADILFEKELSDNLLESKRRKLRSDAGKPRSKKTSCQQKQKKNISINPLILEIMETLTTEELNKSFCVAFSPLAFSSYLNDIINENDTVILIDASSIEPELKEGGFYYNKIIEMGGAIKVSRNYFTAAKPFTVIFDKSENGSLTLSFKQWLREMTLLLRDMEKGDFQEE